MIGVCCFCARERPADRLRFIAGGRAMCTDTSACTGAYDASIARERQRLTDLYAKVNRARRTSYIDRRRRYREYSG